MLSPELYGRYLRPTGLGDQKLDAVWSDSQNAWLPSEAYGYIKVRILERQADNVLIQKPDGSQEKVLGQVLLPCNPMRFDRCEDVAEMGELNIATVLDNLRQRYESNLTYSGLFLVAINPYRQFPIYQSEIIDYYRHQQRADRPPHIFAVADAAYRSLIETHHSQSILITGESGAGKTENTKRVIQYLASVAGSTQESTNLDQQIIQANPILEAFGNAQTVRNNNSSRFGKFVRIEFNNAGVICGGNIEKYLLEKSRITHRNPKERSFHIFYQFLRGAPTQLKNALGIEGSLEDYNYIKCSNHLVEGIEDKTDFEELLQAMNILGFGSDEQLAYFRIIAAILLLGNLSFAEDASKEQAYLLNHDVAERVCNCLGVSTKEFTNGLLHPVLKAGREEVVAQARDVSQVIYSVEALSRTLYDRMFTRLVDRINHTIMAKSPGEGNNHFVGVLDIAGFEIFERNSFEQLCINYTNEKLQQFFNHHMFITEQEEYRREGLEWSWIDFGLDLQPTIDLLEKSNPIGILACLDEDCVMPKATDRSFCEKIGTLWKGKSNKFEMTRFGDGFIVHHYAGRVEYRTDGWLVKNKDPLNDNITRLLARSSDNFVASLFSEYAGNDEEIYLANKGTKRGLFRTIAQKHRESLALLMQTLQSTQPHFVRCIIPNEQKAPGVLQPHLVLDQLQCNGVLEGIRICRLGYPHRVSYSEFLRRYECLAKVPLTKSDAKGVTSELLEQIGLQVNEAYRLGYTKVFLKADELGKLDEMRDLHLSTLLKRLQATFRAVLARRHRTRATRQQGAAHLLQRNILLYLKLRQWPWWKLYTQIRPLLNITRTENRIHELEEELARISLDREQQVEQLRVDLGQERSLLYEAETKRRDLERENQILTVQLDEALESKTALMERKMALDLEMAKLRERIATELEGQREQLQGQLATMEQELTFLRETLAEQKCLVATLRGKLDETEFERIKLEKAEASQRQKSIELEGSLQETLRAKRDLEVKLKQVEESRRKLQEQLEDETMDQERRQQARKEWELQLKQVRQQHEEELCQKEDEWEVTRKRFQREIHQLNFDLEQEKKSGLTLKETIKRYESGADSLATQLETEMRNQNNWRRERERLELRVRELTRLQQEALEREDALASQVASLYEQVRELRAKALDGEEMVTQTERQRKALENKYETLNETYREILTARQAAEKVSSTLEMQLQELSSQLHDEQDASLTLKERVRIIETSLKLTQTELETERRQNERLNQEKAVLEMQIKELQLKLLDSETSTTGNTSRPSHRRPSSTYAQILATIETEGQERQTLVKECRRQERLVRDLQSQLCDREQQRIGLEESLDKGELKLRKLQTAIEALETRNNELEGVKRRAERDLVEEKERSERLSKECERLKSRLQAKSISTDE